MNALHHQFRAGLGHDMRNTLAAMEAGTRLSANARRSTTAPP